jgi:hypothetical protein
MPAVTAITLRFSRKFQLAKDDWVGADALATVTVSEEEANTTDPAEVRAMCIAEARQTVIEVIAAEYLERTQLAARQHAGQMPAGQTAAAATAAAVGGDLVLPHAPAQPPAPDEQSAPTPAPAQPPRTPEEAERRFFRRYGEIIGGEQWQAVQTYLATRAPKPTTVDGWISAAEAVRDTHRMQTTPAMPADVEGESHSPAPAHDDADRPPEGEIEPGAPAEHTVSHAVAHRQPQPRPATDRRGESHSLVAPARSSAANGARRGLK